jgi:2-aminoadipate transaminase
MTHTFAHRINNVQKSFIREILKVTENPEIISFAGGLPHPQFFPVQQIAQATAKVLASDGAVMLQYSTTEGYRPLREWIVQRYHQLYGLDISPDEILITNGSQQGLDLIGKIFLNQGDHVLIERPSYLGAIQAFSMYQPEFQTVLLRNDGIDLTMLEQTLQSHPIKLFYAVTNFQNPSGITYSAENRQAVAQLMQPYSTLFIEDNPYGDLRFIGDHVPAMRCYLGEKVITLGSFSKIVAPGFRLGWICAAPDIMEKLIIAKQAADLHSNYFSQRVIYQYLQDNDLDQHIAKIRQVYGKQRDLMVQLMEELFPPEVQFTRPEGGMFTWVTLPDHVSALELFNLAADFKVAFVPGQPFYVDGGGQNTLRLNFSNTNEERIVIGMQRLADAIKTLV